MSDGHGCDAAGHHCGGPNTASPHGHSDAGYELGADGRTPVPNLKRVTVNGAPVSEASHEYVIRRPPASAQH